MELIKPTYKLYNQKNMALLKSMEDNSLDAVVTDCPYGLGKEPDATETLKAWIETGYHEIKGSGFMGKTWDSFVPQPVFWKEVFRVLKPGGYVLAFFGTRTYDWGVMAIRLAGFEIRDCIQWIYGSGFPKSHDVSKAIDKRNGRFFDEGFKEYCNECRIKKGYSLSKVNELMGTALTGGGFASCTMGDKEQNELPTLEMYRKLKVILEMDDRYGELIEMVEAERDVLGTSNNGSATGSIVTTRTGNLKREFNLTAPSTNAAKQWEGYGSALKPAHEPICVARKPLDGTIANNVLNHDCGAINLDGCRIEYQSEDDLQSATWGRGTDILGGKYVGGFAPSGKTNIEADCKGRFPANIIFDESAAEVLDEQSGTITSGSNYVRRQEGFFIEHGGLGNAGDVQTTYGDTGGASRFFYVAKASKEDRNYGCEGLNLKDPATVTDFRPTLKSNPENWANGTETPYTRTTPKANNHPTVKPISLMRYLVRLVKTPFHTCTIADFFMGSGTTGIACMLEGINFIGCDDDKNSFEISQARTEYAKQEYLKEQAKPKQAKLFNIQPTVTAPIKQSTLF